MYEFNSSNNKKNKTLFFLHYELLIKAYFIQFY